MQMSAKQLMRLHTKFKRIMAITSLKQKWKWFAIVMIKVNKFMTIDCERVTYA